MHNHILSKMLNRGENLNSNIIHKAIKIIVASIVGSLLVCLMSISDNTFDYDTLFVAKNINELSDELNIITNSNDSLKVELIAKNEQIAKLSDSVLNLNDEIVKTESNIDSLKVICGHTDMRGEGITVRIGDNISGDTFNINNSVVHDFDIRYIINDLIAAGAEAVSVNGRRISSNTEVVCMGPVIKINGDAEAAPYIIKAIGDSNELEDAISGETAYAYEIKSIFGIDITLRKSNDVSISKNSETMSFEHAKLFEEGE